MEGRNLYEVRRRMGMQLARRAPRRGGPRDAGARHRGAGGGRVTPRRPGIPYREGMVRNRYTGRTFIQPSQALRHRGVTIKLNPLREVVRGKRLIVVDDSIVRGTTTKQIVALLRRAGARRGPRPDQRAADLPPVLLRHRHVDRDRADRRDPHVDQIREFIGADSLGYLSIRGVLAALDLPYDRFCFACFDGNYPEAGPVRRRAAQVHARGAGRSAMADQGTKGTAARDRVRPGRGRRGGRRARGRTDARRRRLHAPSGGCRRPGRVRRQLLPIPAGYREPLHRRRRPMASGPRPRSPRRSGAGTRSGSTSSRCAPTTSSARAPSRWPSSTTWPSVALDPDRRRGPGRRGRRGLPAGGLRARRWRDRRASGPDGGRRRSTWPGTASGSSSGRDLLDGSAARARRRDRRAGRRPGSTPTATRWSGR